MNTENTPLILAVDRNPRNLELLMQYLNQDGYRILAANSVEELEQVLADTEPIGLALVDVSGFDRSIWKHCECLERKGIPFLIVASRRETTNIRGMSLSCGARGTLFKPMGIRELRSTLAACCKRSYESDSAAPGP